MLTLLTTYPNNNDTGIPTGETLYFIFEEAVDVATAVNAFVLYGPDFDTVSGPDQASWISKDTKENPFYLRSPGFRGVQDCEIEIQYLDTDDVVLAPQPTLTELADYSDIHTKVSIIPSSQLAINTEYSLYLVGGTENDRSLSSRTVWDPVATVAGDGILYCYGGYVGTDDQIVIKITTAGNVGTAKYKWWYATEGEGAARIGKITSRKFRLLEDGVKIRFDGSGFLVNDQWTINVTAPDYLDDSVKITFTTNDGSFVEAPESPSTPASSEPPEFIDFDGSAATRLFIVESLPDDLATNQDWDGVITIYFSEELDEDTVTDDTVTVTQYPVSGTYSDTEQPMELNKKLTVADNVLTIEVI